MIAHGDSRLPRRFWDKVIARPDGTGCWDWTAVLDQSGYGRFHVTGKMIMASSHRLMLETKLGRPLESGEETLHLCDRPCCVNPEHLKSGTHAENMRECIVRGRARRSHGSRHYKTILTDADVAKIRVDPRRQIDIAKAFGISQPAVSAIRLHRTWRHLP